MNPLWEQYEQSAQTDLRTRTNSIIALTGGGADAGLDLISDRFAGQVKATHLPIGRPALQRLVGAAPDNRHCVFYSAAGFTKQARRYAEQHGMTLLRFNLKANRWYLILDNLPKPPVEPVRQAARPNVHISFRRWTKGGTCQVTGQCTNRASREYVFRHLTLPGCAHHTQTELNIHFNHLYNNWGRA